MTVKDNYKKGVLVDGRCISSPRENEDNISTEEQEESYNLKD